MTPAIFVHHRIDAAPRTWQALAGRLAGDGARRLAEAGGALYGTWRSQIGRPRDELQAISVWPKAVTAAAAEQALLGQDPDIRAAQAAGVPVIAYSGGYTAVPLASLDPTVIIDHYDDLPATVGRLLAAAP